MPQRENSVSVSVPLTPTRSDLYWRRIFNKYDHDNDGRISYEELKGIIESREYEHDIPDAVVEKIMRLSDRDNSGYLEFAEFVEMMHRPELKTLFGHYVARYVHCLIAPRSHVDATGCPSESTHGWTSPSTIFSTASHHRSPLSILQVSAAATSTPVHSTAQPQVADRWSSLLYGDGRYEEEYSCWPPAICMVLVSLAEIATYAYDAAHGKMDARGPVATVLVYNPSKRHEAWRFLTYMFVHVGTVHILVNLLVQLFLGVPLEMVHRWWRVMLVYLAGVAAGSLATSLTDPRVYLAGASGGVYALIAAHIATIIMNWKQMDFAVVQLLVFILLAVVDIGTAVYNRYFLNIDENIGYVAHIAGACAGLLVGIGVLRNLEVNSWEKRLWWAAVVLYFVLMISAILANIFWTEHFQR